MASLRSSPKDVGNGLRPDETWQGVLPSAGKCYLWARSRPRYCKCHDMKKLKHEAELFKGALLAGVKYAEGRKAVEFEPTDSASQKLLYIYRLLVHDKIIQPLPEDQVAEATMRHKLAIWYSKQLPKDHPLLK